MTKIANMVECINEELEGAKEYAEKYIECKAKNNSMWANRYREMAMDELKHAGYLHEKVVADIDEIKQVYTAPVDMEEAWERSHKRYVERVAIIKTMLTV